MFPYSFTYSCSRCMSQIGKSERTIVNPVRFYFFNNNMHFYCQWILLESPKTFHCKTCTFGCMWICWISKLWSGSLTGGCLRKTCSFNFQKKLHNFVLKKKKVKLGGKKHLSNLNNSYQCFAEKILAGSQRWNLMMCKWNGTVREMPFCDFCKLLCTLSRIIFWGSKCKE